MTLKPMFFLQYLVAFRRQGFIPLMAFKGGCGGLEI